jgi:hypothetical protein
VCPEPWTRVTIPLINLISIPVIRQTHLMILILMMVCPFVYDSNDEVEEEDFYKYSAREVYDTIDSDLEDCDDVKYDRMHFKIGLEFYHGETYVFRAIGEKGTKTSPDQ